MKNLFKMVSVIAMTALISFQILACKQYDQFCPDCMDSYGRHIDAVYGFEEDCTCTTCGGGGSDHHGYVSR